MDEKNKDLKKTWNDIFNTNFANGNKTIDEKIINFFVLITHSFEECAYLYGILSKLQRHDQVDFPEYIYHDYASICTKLKCIHHSSYLYAYNKLSAEEKNEIDALK